jgi:hypothetical protein
MKRTTLAWICTFACLGVRAEGLDDLAWMSGSWMEHNGATDTEEHWIAPKGGLMMAVNRTVKDGKASDFEFLRIELRDGKPLYLSMPRGRPATEFRVAEQASTRIAFEDPGRDFPRRIAYWRDGEALMARIEGTIGGQPRAKQWRFERMK